VILLKAIGRIPDLTWTELWHNLPPGSEIWLAPLASNPDPNKALRIPDETSAAVDAGRSSFASRCAGCHGTAAVGGRGPSLKGDTLRHGTSPWAMYRTIRNGVPGTIMQPQGMSTEAVWQVVAYLEDLRSRVTRGTDIGEATQGRLDSLRPVTFTQLVDAQAQAEGWLTYSGAYDGQRHSRLSEINRRTVSGLKAQWLFQIPEVPLWSETTPLVRDGVMFVVTQPANVWALDAATGQVLWNYSWRTGIGYPGPEFNPRGLAILGSTLYVATLDARLVALDAKTGERKWVSVVADNTLGYYVTGAPLALQDRIIVGVSGGDKGLRGFLDAYDATTGSRLWRFDTVPGPGEPNHDTWTASSWQHGGGATWLTGTYDPALNVIYWGVGNPSPDYAGDTRPGDNLYTCSVIALDASTGRLRWHFQFSPHETHDWDSTQVPILADETINGQQRKLMYFANRNGFFYVLDRETGQFVQGRPFATQTWADGLDTSGHPVKRTGQEPTPTGTLLAPAAIGATNWWSPSLSRRLGLLYIPTFEGQSYYFSGTVKNPESGYEFMGSRYENMVQPPGKMLVRAIDVSTATPKWEYVVSASTTTKVMGGLLSTDGGLVFGGGPTGNVYALNDETGTELWRYNTGAPAIAAAPVTYETRGRQFLVVTAGRTIVAFNLP
jgi:alcohol dehydrogenase (cytochrome c)